MLKDLIDVQKSKININPFFITNGKLYDKKDSGFNTIIEDYSNFSTVSFDNPVRISTVKNTVKMLLKNQTKNYEICRKKILNE